MTQDGHNAASVAKARFLEADTRYDSSKSLAAVLAHLDRYLDPEERRAPGLRAFVRDLKSVVQDLSSETTSLMLAILQVQIAVQGQAIGLTSRAFDLPGAASGAPTAQLEMLREWRKRMQEASREFASLDWEGQVAAAYDVGAVALHLRAKTIDEFAAKALGLELDYEAAAVAKLEEQLLAMVSEAYSQFEKLLLTEEFWIELVGAGAAALVPYGAALYRVGKAAKSLHDKAKEIAEPYVPRGAIDELFNFVDAVSDAREFQRRQIALLRSQAAFLEAGRDAP